MIEMFTLNAAQTNSTSLSFTFKHSGKLCPYFKFHKTNYQLRVDKDKPKGWFKGNWRDKYSGLLWATLSVWDSETWDTLLILRGTKVIYLDYVGTLRPSKSYRVGWWGWWWGGGGL